MAINEYCENLPRQSQARMVADIDAKILSLKGQSQHKKKAPRFSMERGFAAQHDDDIRLLNLLAEYISGDYNALRNLSESEAEMFQQVAKKVVRT